MPELTDISIEIEPPDEDERVPHACITVESVVVDVDQEPWSAMTMAELYRARKSAAGVLGRLAAHADADMHEQRVQHRCNPREAIEGCHALSAEQVLLPGTDSGSSVAVWFAVPPEHVDEWVEKIRGWLGQITGERPWTDEPREDEPEEYVPVDDPWIPGGDCEHLERGRDRGPVTKLLRCEECRKRERAAHLHNTTAKSA